MIFGGSPRLQPERWREPIIVARGLVPRWHYTVTAPPGGWEKPGFEDAGWKTGHGGFGAAGTPGSRTGTPWHTPEIWTRRTVELAEVPAEPAVLIYHDEDAEVFINGELAARFEGYVTEYHLHRLDAAASRPAGRRASSTRRSRASTGRSGTRRFRKPIFVTSPSRRRSTGR
jgi:hypothetical protein